ncbi:MAG: hypothetical protein JWO70_1352 [Betaproteobacteria bacterium]|jgi:hypothetical protein|nr:hypothetical protein [Betaproteobacteria bacterium]
MKRSDGLCGASTLREASDRRSTSLGLMSRHTVLAFAFALVSLPAFGADDEGYDEYTIRQSDIPKDAPRFRDYAAKRYTGANAAPDVRSDPRSRRYRTQLKGWAREKPNFAGHYILATWGCGTSCTEIAVIDAITGKVFHPPGARSNHIEDVHSEVLVEGKEGERRSDFGALHYRADSRLLILFGTPDGRTENRGISYFVWEHDRLTRIRFVPKAPSTTSK